MRIVFFFFFVIILGSCGNVRAQNPYIRHYTSLDGLPSNSMYQMCQDRNKFMWFTSDAGVVKYDGTNFTSYRKNDGLSSNDVVRIKEDSKGRIWFFNYNGTANYYYHNKIYNGKNAPFLNSLTGKGFFLDFYTDSRHIINFYNWQGEVFSLDNENKVSKDQLFKNSDFKIPGGLNKTNFGRVALVSKTTPDECIIWSSNGVYKQNMIQKGRISVVDSGLLCFAVFPARNNSYYVKTPSNELIKVLGNFKKEKITLPVALEKIRTIIEDSAGYLWIAAYDDGVYCLKKDKIVRHFDIKDALGLFQDREKNIWVSSESDGIYMINHELLEQNHFDRTSFDNQGVNQLCELPGMGIWCTNSKSAFLFKNETFYKLSVPQEILPVNILHVFRNQTLLLGSVSSRLCTFEKVKLKAETGEITYSKRNIHPVTVKKIIEDPSGYVIAMFDQNRIFFTAQGLPNMNSEFSKISERINNAFYTADNKLVINAKKNYLYKNSKLEPNPELSRFDGTIISDHLVLNDSDELYNIDGDSLYILKNHTFINLTDAFDTPIGIQIKKILYDDSTLYLATLKSIFVCHNPMKVLSGIAVHLEPLNISFKNINDILIHKDTLYIASDDGLTIIAEASVAKSNALPPIPYLRSIIINDRVFSLPGKELKLTGKNNIQLSFGCISYSSTPVIYSYKLEGSENTWTLGSGSGINLVYQNLPKGQYIFKLRVRKSNSVWSKPIELLITIKPTLVEHPAFLAFIIILSAGIIILIIFLVRIQKMKKVEVDHQLIVMEQKALQSMMNPHFIFNSLGSIQNYLLNNKGSEAVIYLSQFARLIRQNLNAINTPMIIIEEEVDRLINYIDLEKKRLENKFDYNIEIDAKLEEDGVFIPGMIIQPIAENSIWHGMASLEDKGFIKISFQAYKPKSLKVIIEDNGIGMVKSLQYSAKSSQHHHLGMQIIKKRLALLSKKYNTETGINYSECYPDHINPGTRVELILPFIFTIDD